MTESTASPVEMTTMADGREIAFGKKTAVFNVVEDGNGFTIQGAFVSGEYSSHTIGSVEELHAFAAYGLKAFARAAKLDSAAGFESLNWTNPNAATPRKSKGRKAQPLELAIMEVKGKSLDVVREFLASKSRAERAALAKHPSVSVVLARIKAASTKVDENAPDLLDDLPE